MTRAKMFWLLALAALLCATPALAVTFGPVTISPQGYIRNAAGSASLPSYTFDGDRNSGVYWIAADNIGLTLGGTKRWDFGAATTTLTGDLVVSGSITGGSIVTGVELGTSADGSLTAPGLRFTDDTNTGLYRVGADNEALVVGGANILDVDSNGVDVTGALTSTGAATFTGLLSGNAGFALDSTIFTVANTTGVISWIPTTTTSNAGVLDFTTLTSGNGLKLIGVDATLNAGKYINAYGGNGTVSVWSVGEDGATAITSTAVDTTSLSITNNTAETGDAITITLDDDALTSASGYYINCLGATDHATSVFAVGEGGATVITPTTASNAVDAISIQGQALVTGDALQITVTDGTLTGGMYIKCYDGAATDFSVAEAGAVVVGGTLAVGGIQTSTALCNLNAGLAMETTVFTIADNTGVISHVPTSTTGVAITHDFTTLTTGDGIKLIGVDATLDTGASYLTAYGGTNATQVWDLGESGATTITPNVNSVIALYLDGSASATGDLLKMKAIDATLNGGKYVNCLGGAGAAAVFTVAEDGVTAITSTVATSVSATITNLALTSGDLLVLDADDDTITAGTGLYVNCLGSTDHNTTVFSIAEGGATTIVPTTASAAVDAVTITGTTLVGADAISISLVDATLNGGMYLNCLGGAGATAVFTIAEDGATTITSTVAAGISLSVTNLAATTGDFIVLKGDDDTLTAQSGYYLNCLGASNTTTSVFSIAEGGVTTITPTTAAIAIDAFTIDGTLTTSGDLIALKALDGTLNAGLYINALGGAAGDTAVFTVGEDGATVIASTAVATNSFSITNNATTSGDLIILTADDDTLDTDTYYLNCLGHTDHATSVFSIGEGGKTVITPTVAAKDTDALTITGTALDAGDALCITAVDATLDGGLFINVLGGAAGATTAFTVAEGGVVYSLGSITATDDLHSGTGYAGTGCTLTELGAASFDAALTVGTTSTLTGDVTIGNGYAGTGATITASGSDASFKGDLVVDLTSTLSGAVQAKVLLTAASTSNALTVDATYYGKTLFWSPTDTAAITLPAAGAAAGSWFKAICLTDQTTSYTAAVADTLITRGNTTADGVTFSTASNKIGSAAFLISNGTYWTLTNASDCTMTIVDGA